MNDVIPYTTDDGRNQIKLRNKDATVWLSQREMAQLFDVTTDIVVAKNYLTEDEIGPWVRGTRGVPPRGRLLRSAPESTDRYGGRPLAGAVPRC